MKMFGFPSLVIPIALIILTFFSTFITAVGGMAGGTILLSGMTLLFPLKEVVPIHGLIVLLTNSTSSFYLRKHIRRDFFVKYIIGLPLGGVMAVFLMEKVDLKIYALSLIGCLIAYSLFRPKVLPSIKIKQNHFIILGFVTGVLAVLIGAIGPLLGPFLFRDDLNRKEIIATKTSMQVCAHLLKIPAYIYLGFSYLDHLWLIIALLFTAFISTICGIRLLDKINESLFRRIFKAALLIVGLKIFYRLIFL